MKLVLLFLSSLVSALCVGQSFELTVPTVNGNAFAAETAYGNGVSVYDINKDGWPDLTICRHGLPVGVLLNNEGVFEEVGITIGTPSQARHWNWVDIDNDGDADGCLTSAEGFIELYEQTGDMEFELVTETGIINTTEEVYSNSWGDVNGDGYLDCYIAVYEMLLDEYDERNYLYLNNGDWTFTEMGDTNPANDGYNMSFMGTFMDYDNDNDPDIFVNNDRLDSFNHLYRNDGGTFTDVSTDAGIEEDFYAMSNTIADYNNDGFLDIFMSNNPEGSRLMKNQNGNAFVDASDASNLFVEAFGWAGNFFDFDNDGDLDFHFCSMPFWTLTGQNELHKNDGTGVFTNVTAAAGMDNQPSTTYASAVADFNNDGALDLVVYNEAPFGLQVWMNTADPGNWLEIKPISELSDTDAIGTRLECYAGGSYQMRYTMCGENFLGQNSDYVHFGLGEYNLVDSLVVTWRSGITNTYYNLPSGTSMDVVDVDVFDFAITGPSSYQFCDGDSVVLYTSHAGDVLWSNGETAPTLTVEASGSYYAQLPVGDGLYVSSDSVVVNVWASPTLDLSTTLAVCPWDSSTVTLQPVEPEATVFWSEGDLDGWLDGVVPPGNYVYTLSLVGNPCTITGTLDIPSVASLYTNVFTSDVSCYGEANGSATIELGGFPGADVNWFGVDPTTLPAGTYTPFVFGNLGCGTTLEVVIDQPEPLTPEAQATDAVCFGEATGSATVNCSGGVPDYTFDWQGADPENLTAGAYTVIATDANGCQAEAECTVEEPLELDLDLITTGTVNNQVEVLALATGGTSPYTISWDNGSEILEGELVLLDDLLTYEVTVSDANGCTLNLSYTNVDDLPHDHTAWFYPNPSTGLVYLRGLATSGTWVVTAIDGKQIRSGALQTFRQALHLEDLPAGVYIMQLHATNKVWKQPLVLTD